MPTRDQFGNFSVRIDEIADRFESTWRTGSRPAIADYLETIDLDHRPALLVELIKLDLEYRLLHGESPRIDEYLARFPELEGLPEPVDELVLYWRRFIEENDAARDRRPQCPHCSHTIETIEPHVTHVRCPACGSSFHRNVATAWTDGAEQRPQVIGKFRVEGLLGTGSFGAVYRARDTQLDRIVALKIPRSGYFPSAEDRERFMREARSTARLDHAGIVPVYEIGYDGDVPYIVSAYVDGNTLADAVGVRQYAPREAAQLVEQVARAAHYAHERDVIHRDLKPTNILLDRAGNPYVTDFGLARHDANDVVLTVDGQIVGTPAYMSPEQAAGDSSSVNRRSDVYSLGVVLYELLAAERPFRGNTRMLLDQVLHHEPRMLRALNDRIPRDLETICLKAMDKAPARRFATADAMADDLRRFLDGQPIEARPVGNAERAWRWARRNPTVSGLAASLALLLTVAAIAGTWAALKYAGLMTDANRLAEDAQRRLARSVAGHAVDRLEEGDDAGLLGLLRAYEIATEPRTKSAYALLINGWHAEYRDRLLQVASHDGAVVRATFSPDGRSFATLGLDGFARVWSTESGKMIFEFRHGKPLGSQSIILRFSPDGRYLAAASRTPRVNIWDLDSGSTVISRDAVAAAFHPGGQLVALIEVNPTKTAAATVAIWSLVDHQLVRRGESQANVELIEFSPDGTLFLTAQWGGPCLAQLWKTGDGSPRGTPLVHHEGIRAVAFSPDGSIFATTGMDHVTRLWNAADGQLHCPPLPHNEDIHALAFSPDGRLLATGSYDGTARIWNVEAEKLQCEPLRHDGPVLAVAFGPDPQHPVLASGGYGGVVRLWNAETGEPQGKPFRHQHRIRSIEFHPGGSTLIAASMDSTARIWNATLPERRATAVLDHPHRVWGVAFSADATHVATAAEDGFVRIWKRDQAGDPISSHQHSDEALEVVFVPHGNVLISSGQRQLRFWNTMTGQEHRSPLNLDHASRSLAVGPRGERIGVTAPYSGQFVLLYDVPADVIHRLGDACGYKGIAFHPDGKRLAAGGLNGVVYVWNCANRRLLYEFEHGGQLSDVTFSPDGRLLASASEEQTVQLWNCDSGQPYGEPRRHRSSVESLAFGGGGRWLVTALGNGSIRLWDSETGLPIGLPYRHDMFATSVRVSQDSRWLASSSLDQTAHVWQLPEYLHDLDAERIRLRVLTAVGAAAGPTAGVKPIGAAEWQDLKAQLRAE